MAAVQLALPRGACGSVCFRGDVIFSNELRLFNEEQARESANKQL